MLQIGYVCNMMPITRIHILLIALLTPAGVFACLNSYYPAAMPLSGNQLNLDRLLYDDKAGLAYWRHFNAADEGVEHKLDSFKRVGLANLDYRGKSDYAVLILRYGDKMEAVRILEPLYVRYPNEYNIAANLGTAYELTGNNARALELLRKAVAMNPHSHYGSEWIHVRLLEEKLGGQQYDKVINLGINDFGQWIIDKQYAFPRNPDSLKLQIAYQLHERIGFITPPDPIIAPLVMDFADIVAKTGTRQEALPFYDFALKYEPSLSKTVAGRKEAIHNEQQEIKGTFRFASIVWALPLLAFFAILFAWMKAIRKNKAENRT